ncbi:hypothetical protein BGW39_008496 [Mortierella sp. 14UC]|nr:hypothetical protein BGW39_008496 [Mortierella sp. 14UC]
MIGLGHIASQWAAAMGCREIVAISGRDNKKEEAFKLGATKFINTNDKEKIKHGVRPWIEKRPFEDCNVACKDVHAGKPRYRTILETNPSTVPSTSSS